MENRKELVVEIALLSALLGALLFGMYKYTQRADAAVDRYFQELRQRRAPERPRVKLGMTEQQEFDLLMRPLLLDAADTVELIDREIRDWWEDHPFYEWGEVV